MFNLLCNIDYRNVFGFGQNLNEVGEWKGKGLTIIFYFM
jgi:hypothetical protein